MHLDAILYVLIAVCGFVATILGSDEANKMFTSQVLFWFKLSNGSLLAGVTALKMYRSTAFSDWKATKTAETNSELTPK